MNWLMLPIFTSPTLQSLLLDLMQNISRDSQALIAFFAEISHGIAARICAARTSGITPSKRTAAARKEIADFGRT
jgi:hypothetical protein